MNSTRVKTMRLRLVKLLCSYTLLVQILTQGYT